jgi:hypothetical protein
MKQKSRVLSLISVIEQSLSNRLRITLLTVDYRNKSEYNFTVNDVGFETDRRHLKYYVQSTVQFIHWDRNGNNDVMFRFNRNENTRHSV